jgi:Nif-specific regulatory protein
MSEKPQSDAPGAESELKRQLLREVEQRNALLAVVKMMNSERDLSRLLEMIATEAARILDADRSTIFLVDRRRKEFFSAPALGVADEIRFPLDHGIAGHVFQTGRLVNAPEAREHPSFTGEIDRVTGYSTRSLLAVPMKNMHGEMIGVFEALNSKRGRFSGEDAELLSAFASHAAIAIENARAHEELSTGRDRILEALKTQHEIAGKSPAVMRLLDQISRVAASEATVLLRGESGTGKELAARAVHYESRRRAKPLVCLNCAALPETLLESELFGHEKGAFTGAIAMKKGKFELAHEGTIFLDEVGSLSQASQQKLLRVLEQGTLERVGGQKTLHVDVRVIAATNEDLERAVSEGRFRQDLYYRLRVIEMLLPALRERGDDVKLLANHFLEKLRAETGHRITGFSPRVFKVLEQYRWPGNVRELKNAVERAVVFCKGLTIEVEDLGLPLSPRSAQPASAAEPRSLQETEKEQIRRALDQTDGHKVQAARILGIDRSTLYRKMKRYEIE